MDRFANREDAGRMLAVQLAAFAKEHPLILGLPRGGVAVAYEIARALRADLDVLVVRKIGVPWHPELGMGAIAEGGHVHHSREIVSHVAISDRELAEATNEKRREVEERVEKFRGDLPRVPLMGRTVILVDDGIATGGTVLAAIRAARAEAPGKVVVAVPVATPEMVRLLESEVDRVVCLRMQSDLYAIGLWYEDFDQVSDDDVVRLLDRARGDQVVGEQRPVP